MKKRITIGLLLLWMCCWVLPAGTVWAESAVQGVVVIDAAHGGTDQGVKFSDNLYEKEVTLKLALLLQKELARSGTVKAVLTRDKDASVSMQDRLKVVNAVKPRAMISLHCNAGFGKTARGFEVYFPGFKAVKTEKEGPSAIISDMQKNKYLNDSVRLAQAIQKQLESVFPKENRGLREAPLQLLEGMTLPAVVVEIGFAGHSDNKKILTGEKYQQEIARSLSKAIRDSL